MTPGMITRRGDVNSWLRSLPIIVAPFRLRRPCREAKERERSDLEHGRADAERALHDQRRDRVGHHAPAQDVELRVTQRAGRGDVVLLAHGQHRRAHDTGIDGHRHDRHRDHGVGQGWLQDGDDDERQQQGREGQEHVHDAHQPVVRPAAQEARRPRR